MCGRYALFQIDDVYERFGTVNRLQNAQANYNTAPGNIMPTISRNSPNQVIERRWGLIPPWAKDIRIGYKLINARAETITQKPSFQGLIRHQRCLVPANGFYEWKRQGETKQPYYIGLKNRALFAFAGLYEEAFDTEGKPLLSYTIITTAPNALTEPIHNRMPVMLKKEDEDIWLDPEAPLETVLALLSPYPANMMHSYPVSKAVNSARNNSAELLQEVVKD
jgi:putative SOS response-associated peptidase YedK